MSFHFACMLSSSQGCMCRDRFLWNRLFNYDFKVSTYFLRILIKLIMLLKHSWWDGFIFYSIFFKLVGGPLYYDSWWGPQAPTYLCHYGKTVYAWINTSLRWNEVKSAVFKVRIIPCTEVILWFTLWLLSMCHKLFGADTEYLLRLMGFKTPWGSTRYMVHTVLQQAKMA